MSESWHHPVAEDRWAVVLDATARIQHVVPVNDLIPHDIVDDDGDLTLDSCVCGPAIYWPDGEMVVVRHFSLDGRDAE